MDSRPPNLLLLLTSLLHFSQCDRTQPSYIIDTIGLTVLPSSTVQSGTAVTLRCQVSVSHDNISDLTHAFQFKRDDVPIHSTNTTEDSVEYELNPARAADSGNYQCQVRVKDKSKTSHIQNLDVTGLQTPILLLDQTTPYESQEFSATCSAPEEKGFLMFWFYQKFRTGETLKLKQLAASKGNSATTTLVLRQVGDSFLYCDYEIVLVSGPRRSNNSEEIQVIVKALHIVPVMNVMPSDEMFEGELMEVVCKVVDSPRNVDVFLIKNRTILEKGIVALNHRIRLKESHSGKLVCKAEWGSVQKETYKLITVKELFSKPNLTVQPIDIFEGDLFKLTCSISIHHSESIDSNSMQFFIYKDNVNLNTSDTYMTVARPDNNGIYTCTVKITTSAYSLIKESPKLAVKIKVPVSKPMLSVVGGTLVLGKPFQLQCHSDNGTLPIKYILDIPNKMFEVRVVSQPGERAVFNSSAIFKSSDLNRFLCNATNSRRRFPETGSVQELKQSPNIIEPVSKPELTVQSDTRDISEGQPLTLVCSLHGGSPPFSFSWYRTGKKDALYSHTSKKMEESYTIKEVKREDGGEYYCVSTNPANEAKHSYSVSVRVTLAGWKKGLIAVFCIILILVLMLAFTFKKCFRQFKRRRTGELSVKATSTKVERLSLTQAEVIDGVNATPGMMGKSIWSEHVSGSDSDDQNSVTTAEPKYAEVQIRQADPNRELVKKGTDTVYSEVRNSTQGVPVQAEGGSVEYAQLNHDTGHHSDAGHHGDDVGQGDDRNQGDHSVQDEHIVEITNSAEISE